MNKLCYIEVCTEKLDAPQLALSYINSIKSKTPYTTVAGAKSNYTTDNIEELVNSTPEISSYESGFQYETVVHQVFSEDQECDNKEENTKEKEEEGNNG